MCLRQASDPQSRNRERRKGGTSSAVYRRRRRREIALASSVLHDVVTVSIVNTWNTSLFLSLPHNILWLRLQCDPRRQASKQSYLGEATSVS